MKDASSKKSQVQIVALLFGPDRPGLVSLVASWIYERGGNIYHADQHRDDEANIFFQRVVWTHDNADPAAEAECFRQMAVNDLKMNVRVALSTDRPKVAVFVSKIEHCYHDICLRFKSNEMPADLSLVVSNHETLRAATDGYGFSFHYIPVSKETKEAAEAEQIKLIQKEGISLVVMARYMQVLSQKFLDSVGCPVINIHHSFLPAFAGGRPYHQAFSRGVKLIGATAHYATADLDEGPIISQEVSRVSHRHSVKDLIHRGKDLERTVFARAIRWHLENRILVYNNKTVVFD